MKCSFSGARGLLALAVAGMLAMGPALGKSDKGKHKGHQKGEHGAKVAHFEDRHRVVLRDYYGEQHRAGRCPPGLAKKNNGCMPPGQAKKWRVGQPLPRDVVVYTVPQALIARIGPPPSGYRYVRVGPDILVISIGSRMVVDVLIV